MDYGLAQLSVRTDQKEGSLKESTTSTTAGTSTENQLLFSDLSEISRVGGGGDFQ